MAGFKHEWIYKRRIRAEACFGCAFPVLKEREGKRVLCEPGDVTDILGTSPASSPTRISGRPWESLSSRPMASRRRSKLIEQGILILSSAEGSKGQSSKLSGSSSRPEKSVAGTRNKSLMELVSAASRGVGGDVGGGRSENGSIKRRTSSCQSSPSS